MALGSVHSSVGAAAVAPRGPRGLWSALAAAAEPAEVVTETEQGEGRWPRFVDEQPAHLAWMDRAGCRESLAPVISLADHRLRRGR